MKKTLLPILLLFYCLETYSQRDPNQNNSNSNHFIGEYFGGGIIFDLFKDNNGREHGLIVALIDLPNEQIWSDVLGSSVGISNNDWNGMVNSRAIARQSGHSISAAKSCLELNNGGYNDWYLPTYKEMGLLLSIKFKINHSLSQIHGATEISDTEYWTSTEYDSENAWTAVFYELGTRYLYGSKGNLIKVRAIRAF